MVSWEVDLIALVVIGIGVVISWVKMQKSIEANKALQEVEITHIAETVTELKEDFKDMLNELKEDLKEAIETSHEAGSVALESTKDELKEYISRLEKKQAESNRIKERLAKCEVYIEHLMDIHDVKQIGH